jgi:hypothetical protein
MDHSIACPFYILLIVPFFFGYGGGLEKKDRAVFLFVREREREKVGGMERRGRLLEGLAVFIAF